MNPSTTLRTGTDEHRWSRGGRLPESSTQKGSTQTEQVDGRSASGTTRNEGIVARAVCCALFLLTATTGCGDHLTGPKVDTNPNRVTDPSADLLFNAVQMRGFLQQEEFIPQNISIWMQQMAGTDRQYLGYGRYSMTEGLFTNEMTRFYAGGGLVDIREIRRRTEEKDWRAYSGIAKVWEGLNMGTAASLWGDLPYSEAVSDVETPRLDPQREIYDALQVLLDGAVSDLESGQGYLPPNDHVYDGDLSRWIEAAYTLKARLHMHWSDYGPALAAAQRGISSPSGNFRTRHADAGGEWNAWHTFFRTSASFMSAGRHLVDLLAGRQDPRLAIYFAPTATGEYVGADPGETNVDASKLGAFFQAPDLAFEILSWAETQLIWAECAYQLGDETTALEKLNEVRAGMETKWSLPVGSLPPLAGLSGQDLFEAILEEKYIALFLNIEAWNDWKRTNLPPLVPFSGSEIPRRLIYGIDERNANPNVPPPDSQPSRNANDS